MTTTWHYRVGDFTVALTTRAIHTQREATAFFRANFWPAKPTFLWRSRRP